MTRISDLRQISTPSLTDVTTVSDGSFTYRISLGDLKTTIVPIATKLTKGVVRVGDGLTVDDAGLLSVSNYSNYTLPAASSTILGGVLVGDNLTVDSTGRLNANLVIDTASRSRKGVVKIGDGIELSADGTISVIPASSTTIFDDTGITIGNNFSLSIEGIAIPTISTGTNQSLNFVVDTDKSLKLISGGLASGRGGSNIPALIPDSTMTLGLENYPWHSIYADNIYGNITGIVTKANSVLYNNSYISINNSASINTIPVRDSNGAITAARFIGESDKATTIKVGSSYLSADIQANPNTIPSRDASGQITATRLIGIANNSDNLKLNNSYVAASIATVNNTIAARDSNGDITTRQFVGVATTAKYADLAEKYIADDMYDVGTVVIFGGDYEITNSYILSDVRVAGVISEYPAYLMNSDSEGLPVALRGKVPVKIIGTAEKGDLLVTSSIPGYAISVGKDKSHGVAIFAKCIENKTNHDRGTVMAVII